jgi:hypothetical protein
LECERMFIIRRQCFCTAFLSPWLSNKERLGPCDRQRRKMESIGVIVAVLEEWIRDTRDKALRVLCLCV